MVLLVIVVVGIGIEELELTDLGICGLKHLGCVATILLGVHHVDELGQLGDTCGNRC